MVRDDAWRRIRTLRSRPPGLAAGDAQRRAVFGAALQQSEELFLASASVSPASKPLPLFYALSQAGRAVAAAYNPDTSWQIRGHGLSVLAGSGEITATVVTPVPRRDRSDSFSSVARALGSGTLNGPVSVASLWAALPELVPFRHLAGDAVSALEIRPEGQNPGFFPTLHPALGSVVVPDVTSEDELATRLARYARTEGWEAIVGPLQVGRVSHVTLEWPAEPSTESTPGTKAFRQLNEIAICIDHRWFLQPLLGEPPAAPDPLLVWWALLIALSSLARYHPASWTAALDVDAAATAVELEEALSIAECRLPEMLASALERPFNLTPMT